MYSLGFRLLSVVDERGHPHTAKVTKEGKRVQIRIGDADRMVSGQVVYVLRYRVRNALGKFAEHDELYWNATGNEWRARIAQASARIDLPAPFETGEIQTSAYTGRFGSRENAAEITHPEPGVISYRATRELSANEGLTVGAAWPTGAIAYPGPVTSIARIIADNWILIMPVIILVLMVRYYRRVGRDPDAGAPVAVKYEAPTGLSPGEMGVLVDEDVDLRDITATIVDLAVRGHIRIVQEEDDSFLGNLLRREETFFERLEGDAGDSIAPHESRILSGMFGSAQRVGSSDLKEKFYAHLPGIRTALYRTLVDRGFFVASPQTVRRTTVGLGFLASALVLLVGGMSAVQRGGILPVALVVPLIAAAVSFAVFLGFARAMPKRTRTGVKMRSWALGFGEFVDRVERDRLERDEARHIFETLLPYAMALGYSSSWAKKFDGIYEESSPTWHTGWHAGHGFSTRSFEKSLSSTMSDVGKNLVSSPRSSGGGGGGFSGGGGGGGGGGSW
jgi:hypothetical protein